MPTPIPVLYHGTNHAFERFDARHLGASCDNPTTLLGFFFSEDPEEALTWATRASERRRAPCDPRVISVRLTLNQVLEMTYERFHYYLQTARPSTVARHLQRWKDQGYDGLTVVRGGIRWYAAFDPAAITLLHVARIATPASATVQAWVARVSGPARRREPAIRSTLPRPDRECAMNPGTEQQDLEAAMRMARAPLSPIRPSR